uniref:Si:ch211-38m6.6 n=1 Tax=Sinocyclocheilus rhinocerous TaxID=307959 RepID=A0A673IY69_9TELE
MWRYLQLLEAPPYFLGLGLSAFSFSGLVSGPMFGNVMYFMGYSKWPSYIVAGISIGAGAGSSIFGFLTLFAAVMACRQAGLLIGPAFNIFLRLCDFKLGPFVVNKYTSPGVSLFCWPVYFNLAGLVLFSTQLFMCGMWVLMQFAVIYIQSCLGSFEMPEIYSVLSLSVEFLREEVVVLLTAQFITLFNQTALETMVTPLTQKYFGFGELGNSVMYSLCGVEVIAGFFLVRWLSRVLEDRVVLAVGLLICSGACVWCLIFLANPQGVCMCLIVFIIGVFLQLLGLPFVAVSQVSLFSKVTAEKTQGFSQGVRRSVGGLATILGPLWAGGLIGNLYVMLGMMMLLLTLIMIMMVLSHEKLVEPPRVEHAQDSENGA